MNYRRHYKWYGAMFMLLACLAPCLQAAAPRNWPLLESGSREDEVKGLQYLLLARGSKVVTDGYFGAQTLSAVKQFQHAHHLVADGKVRGPLWEVLIVRLQRGSKGYAVRALQSQLRGAGYAVPMDGVFGAQTLLALKKFQTLKGLKSDGMAGPYTWCGLMGGDSAQFNGGD